MPILDFIEGWIAKIWPFRRAKEEEAWVAGRKWQFTLFFGLAMANAEHSGAIPPGSSYVDFVQ